MGQLQDHLLSARAIDFSVAFENHRAPAVRACRTIRVNLDIILALLAYLVFALDAGCTYEIAGRGSRTADLDMILLSGGRHGRIISTADTCRVKEVVVVTVLEHV